MTQDERSVFEMHCIVTDSKGKLMHHNVFRAALHFFFGCNGISYTLQEEVVLKNGGMRVDAVLQYPPDEEISEMMLDSRRPPAVVEFKPVKHNAVLKDLVQVVNYANQNGAENVEAKTGPFFMTAVLAAGGRIEALLDTAKKNEIDVEKCEPGIYDVFGLGKHTVRIWALAELEGKQFAVFRLMTETASMEDLDVFLNQLISIKDDAEKNLAYTEGCKVMQYVSARLPELYEEFIRMKGDSMTGYELREMVLEKDRKTIALIDRLQAVEEENAMKDDMLAMQNARIAKQDNMLAMKNGELAEKDRVINSLREELAKLQK